MAFPGHNDPTGTAQYAGIFIPEIWAGKFVEKFYDATVLAAISNTDYQGEIKSYGDKVHIRTVPDVSVSNYVRGQPLTTQRPAGAKVELNIDKGKYFQCVEEDVDRVQADVKLMDLWSRDASEKMKIAIDTDVLAAMLTDIAAQNKGATAGKLSGNINLGTTATPVAITKSNVLDYIVDLGLVLDEQNIPESDRFMVVPAWFAAAIKKSDLKDASITGDGVSVLRNGRLGMIDRFTLYSSNLLSNAGGKFYPIAGVKAGLTFATQMTNMETLRSETTFGNIVRGLQVFGWKVVDGKALAHGCVTKG